MLRIASRMTQPHPRKEYVCGACQPQIVTHLPRAVSSDLLGIWATPETQSVRRKTSSKNLLDMIYTKSLVKVLDNSGAKIVECIKVLRKNPKNCAVLGDRMVVAVKSARPPPANLSAAAASQRVKKGDVRHAILVRTKKFTQRPDGSQIRFDENACVLLSKGGDVIGTRVLGPIAKEVQEKGHMKIAALAPRLV